MNRVEILETALDRVVDKRLKALDRVLADMGAPDKALDKPYATFDGRQIIRNWTEQEVSILKMIYGDALNKIIADREYKVVKQLEKAAGL
jgi:hypothetical protein